MLDLQTTLSHIKLNPQETSESPAVSLNERFCLDLIRRGQKVSRADLTRATGLTAQSISRLVEGLLNKGYLALGETVIHGRGKPTPLYKLKSDAVFSVGLSIMTDALTATLMNFTGTAVAQTTEQLEDLRLESVLDVIERIVHQLTQQHVGDAEKLFGIGVGITGYFINIGRQVNPPDPLNELAFIDLDTIISERLKLPVSVDNDGNVAAIGESLNGVGNKYDTFAYMYFSKGLGGSIVIDRKMCRGAFGNSGEFAAILPAHAHDERPTLELLRQSLVDNGVNIASISDLINQYDPNWPGIDAWVARVRPHLDRIIAAITSVIDPQAIVLGGRIPRALAERLSEEITFDDVVRRGVAKPHPKLVPSDIKGDATSIGAASVLFKTHFFI